MKKPDAEECCIRAETFIRRGEIDYAITYYQKALDQDPESFEAHLNMAIILEDSDRQKSIKHYETATKIDKNNKEAFYGLGRIHGMEGNLDEAIKCFTDCIRIDPFDGRPYSGLGVAFSMKKDYEESKRCFEKALELSPFDFNIRKVYARVLDEMEEKG